MTHKAEYRGDVNEGFVFEDGNSSEDTRDEDHAGRRSDMIDLDQLLSVRSTSKQCPASATPEA